MAKSETIDGVELHLSSPDVIEGMDWIGGEVYMSQLLAAWIVVDKVKDIPMNPQILGKPGVGKTTLAYSAAKNVGLPVFIFQCTVDTRPEDLLISPVIGEHNTIKYHASPLVTAMIEGGVCILDEANRMSEKSWASLAPLLDQRRYIESIIAGVKVKAHSNFRICVTMNDDSSTFEVPEYIHSRLQPQVFVEFPDREEEFKILQFNLPFAKEELLAYTVEFLQRAHRRNKHYSIRDGINICRYYLKVMSYFGPEDSTLPDSEDILDPEKFANTESEIKSALKINKDRYRQAVLQILGRDAIGFLFSNEKSKNTGSDYDDFVNRFGSFKDQFDRFFDEEDMSPPVGAKTEEWDPASYSDDDIDEGLLDDLDLGLSEDEFKFELMPKNGDKVKFSDEDVLNIIEKDDPEDPENPAKVAELQQNTDQLIRDFLNRTKKSKKKKKLDKNQTSEEDRDSEEHSEGDK